MVGHFAHPDARLFENFASDSLLYRFSGLQKACQARIESRRPFLLSPEQDLFAVRRCDGHDHRRIGARILLFKAKGEMSNTNFCCHFVLGGMLTQKLLSVLVVGHSPLPS